MHALQRMFEREISHDDVLICLKSGEVIEDYPEDEPYPSQLILGWSGSRPIHTVVAISGETGIIVTVYEPDPEQWDASFRHRSDT